VTARAKKPDAFGSMLDALRALYEQELARLADLYRPRILAGEFSGNGPDGPRYLALERELGKTHPWLATQRGRLAVEAASRWITSEHISVGDGATEYELGDCASECMANDVMAVAAERGWVRHYTGGFAKGAKMGEEDEVYELRVA
jgi:hypothetical protein